MNSGVNVHEQKTLLNLQSACILAASAYRYAEKSLNDFPFKENIFCEDGKNQDYIVHPFILKSEIYGYYLLPANKNDGNIKVIFRGTDNRLTKKGARSALINLEAWGPAVESFTKESDTILNTLISAISEHYSGTPPSLSLFLTGHSQGGALCQLFIAELLRQRLTSNYFDNITHVNMALLNSPGISYEIANQCDERAKWQSYIGKPLSLSNYFGMVGGDAIQTLGLDMVFAKLLSEIAENHLIKLDKGFEKGYRKCLEDGLQIDEFFQFLQLTLDSLLGSHHVTNFNPPFEKYEYYNNLTPEGHKQLLKEVLNKKATTFTLGYYVTYEILNDLQITPYLKNLSDHTVNVLTWLRNIVSHPVESDPPSLEDLSPIPSSRHPS